MSKEYYATPCTIRAAALRAAGTRCRVAPTDRPLSARKKGGFRAKSLAKCRLLILFCGIESVLSARNHTVFVFQTNAKNTVCNT